MSNFQSDITEQFLNKTYDDFSKEQQRILNDIKSGCDDDKINYNEKQFNIINSLLLNILKLRNLKKKQKLKIDN